MMMQVRAAVLRGAAVFGLITAVAACSGSAGPGINDGIPLVSLSAMPANITAGSGTTLTWSSTDATSCAASGGWRGPRGTSGSEVIASLTRTTSFTLSCTGSGGSGQRTVQVSVSASTTAPTLTFTASQTEVTVNSNVALSWVTTNATSCTASGAWSGSRPTAGSQIVGPLATSSVYTLTCADASGASVQRSVTIAVIGPSVNGGLSGSVDSSMIDLAGSNQASNQIYVFNGTVTPRDTQGTTGDPVFKLPVTQDANACTFSYALPSLDMGTYTLAFTSQAQQDRPTQADALSFVGTATVTVGTQAARRNFRPASVLQVGPGRQFSTIAAAAAAASAGAVIEVDSGVYLDDIVVWRRNGVVVRGVGPTRPVVQATRLIGFASGSDRTNGKGIWVVDADRMRIENFEMSGARVADENGAAIRNSGRDLTICNAFLHDNENGFLGAAFGTLTIEYGTFADNGRKGPMEGFTHNVYIDEGSAVGDRLVFRHNYSHRANIGHNLKTRARENFILYNRIMDENEGTASYAIDVSDGGISYVIGNLLQQGPNTDNPDIVAFNLEDIDPARPQELYLVNNTFVNDLGSGAFVNVRSDTTTFRSINNLFVGNGTLYRGKLPSETTNLRAPSSVLVNAASFDYRLNPGVTPINAGTDPGSVSGVSLVPEFHYVDFGLRERRMVIDATDVGAYEAAP